MVTPLYIHTSSPPQSLMKHNNKTYKTPEKAAKKQRKLDAKHAK